jgi:hypothetical protein
MEQAALRKFRNRFRSQTVRHIVFARVKLVAKKNYKAIVEIDPSGDPSELLREGAAQLRDASLFDEDGRERDGEQRPQAEVRDNKREGKSDLDCQRGNGLSVVELRLTLIMNSIK